MRISESLRSGSKSLSHNKLRTFLTTLGIIIGVCSVIMLTSIGEGLKREITAQVEDLGANLLFVMPGKINIQGMPSNESKLGITMDTFGTGKSTLTYQDVLNLRDIPGVLTASGIYYGVDYLDDLNLMVSTTGVDEDFTRINKLQLAGGRFIEKDDRRQGAAVAVIGQQARKEIFPGKNPLGRRFSLNGKEYTVIGLLKYKKPRGFGPGAEDLNVKIYLPVTEMTARSQDKKINQISIRAASSQEVAKAERLVQERMERNHRREDFTVFKQQDILSVINNIMRVVTAALGGIAAISLLVGGVGIMNIMLVSVAERTREIGIRKAIGARRRDILVQFLIEAMVLSSLGGVAGLLLGIGGARVLPTLYPSIRTAAAPAAVTLALSFALIVGLFFGVYPAVKASRLDPIEALRSE